MTNVMFVVNNLIVIPHKTVMSLSFHYVDRDKIWLENCKVVRIRALRSIINYKEKNERSLIKMHIGVNLSKQGQF